MWKAVILFLNSHSKGNVLVGPCSVKREECQQGCLLHIKREKIELEVMIHGHGMMTDGYRKSFGEILVEEGELVSKPTPFT